MRGHAYVIGLIKAAEYAYLGKLGDTCEKDELKVCIGFLEDRVERFEDIAVTLLDGNAITVNIGHEARVHDVKQRLVILVHKHDTPLATLRMSGRQNLSKPLADTEAGVGLDTILALPNPDVAGQVVGKSVRKGEIGAIEINVEDRVSLPLGLKRLYGKAFEEVTPPKEIALEGREQQALAEPPRTAHEIDLALVHERVDKRGLVNIDKAVGYYVLESLYSYWVFHKAVRLSDASGTSHSTLHKDNQLRQRCKASF